MNIASLFQTLRETSRLQEASNSLLFRTKLNPPGSTEFDFLVNRAAGRIADPRDSFGSLELVRVRTRTPYSWKGSVDVPDRTIGILHRLKCEVLIEGVLPADELFARRLLARVLQDKWDYDRLLGRALDDALATRGDAISGRFVQELRQRKDQVLRDLLADLRREQPLLGIERVDLVPTSYDTLAERNLSDETSGVLFRAQDMLEENRIGYKARLVWGRADPHVIARLAYRGAVEGKDVKGPPAPQLVVGQVEPLEAWFRQLLAEELGREKLADVLANGKGAIEQVRDRISERLGRGTGRVLESLVIHVLQGDFWSRAERSLKFVSHYDIAEVGGAEIVAVHTVRYALEDRDRWTAAGKEEPETFLKRAVVDATRLFLNDKQFEEIVKLFLDQRSPADQADARLVDFRMAVEEHVRPIARAHGHKINSTSALLTIPQQKFIDGHEIQVKGKYALAEPYLDPPIELTATVKLANGDREKKAFASVLARHRNPRKSASNNVEKSAEADLEVSEASPEKSLEDTLERSTEVDLEESIEKAVDRAVRATLGGCSALKYYGSAIVNGLPVDFPLPPSDNADPRFIDVPAANETSGFGSDPLLEELKRAIGRELRDQFGLELIRLDLRPGKDDILITRMRELAELPIDYPSPDGKQIFTLRGRSSFIVNLEARATIFVHGPSKEYWRSFQYSVPRIRSTQDHVNEIRGVLTKALEVLQNLLISEAIRNSEAIIARASEGGSRLLSRTLGARVIDIFTTQIREQYGLDVRLHPLVLFLDRPKGDGSRSMVVASLHEDIKNLLHKRASTDDEFERDRFTALIAKSRAELATEAHELSKEINQVEALQISQNLVTGNILPAQLGAPENAAAQNQESSAALPKGIPGNTPGE